jgi:hypothetical protein
MQPTNPKRQQLIGVMLIFLCSFINFKTQAQEIVPSGYAKARIVLQNNTILNVFAKENIHRSATIITIAEAGAKKKVYTGNEIQSVEMDSLHWVCIQGDFFRVLSKGELYFLQKSSDVVAKPVYNGTEPIIINGTEGKKNDYFFYQPATLQLTLIKMNNLNQLLSGAFRDCTEAIAMAKAGGDDPVMLAKAVEIYNRRNN